MGKNNQAELGFELKLFKAADRLRTNQEPGTYKNIVLGLIFLKYVSDAFNIRHSELLNQTSDGADPEDPDEYRAVNVFWVPEKARWNVISGNARQSNIGMIIDEAMQAIEDSNSSLVGALSKDYARPTLDQAKLGEVVDLISTIDLVDKYEETSDVLGRVYEYFLKEFASAEGKKGGEFYTPRSVVKLLVSMLEPKIGSRVYDPCCGSGGMFIQSEKFIAEHGGKIGDISVYGQESKSDTWCLAKLNLAIRGIDCNLGDKADDTFTKDKHPNLKADIIIANPPFNLKSWWDTSLKNDKRWDYGTPPEGNANYAWIQHMIYHLADDGTAGFVLSNGSLTNSDSGEGDIRQNIIEDNLVDCIILLPGKLFYTTSVPACLWFISRNKIRRTNRSREEILFINASNLGHLIDRTHKELSEDDIALISETYHNWKCGDPKYVDKIGYSKSVKIDSVREKKYKLNPRRYVGIAPPEDDGVPFEVKMSSLTRELSESFSESEKIRNELKKDLEALGFGI